MSTATRSLDLSSVGGTMQMNTAPMTADELIRLESAKLGLLNKLRQSGSVNVSVTDQIPFNNSSSIVSLHQKNGNNTTKNGIGYGIDDLNDKTREIISDLEIISPPEEFNGTDSPRFSKRTKSNDESSTRKSTESLRYSRSSMVRTMQLFFCIEHLGIIFCFCFGILSVSS